LSLLEFNEVSNEASCWRRIKIKRNKKGEYPRADEWNLREQY
jgi:hypothetical protein